MVNNNQILYFLVILAFLMDSLYSTKSACFDAWTMNNSIAKSFHSSTDISYWKKSDDVYFMTEEDIIYHPWNVVKFWGSLDTDSSSFLDLSNYQERERYEICNSVCDGSDECVRESTYIVLISLVVAGCILWRRRYRRTSEVDNQVNSLSQGAQEKTEDSLATEITPIERDNSAGEYELPLFVFSTIELGTDYFSVANELGQGGFGKVYKGILPSGELIAVKRLSKNSEQGLEEFKNELDMVVELQHINIVRLLGWYADMEEKILIYEYMENGSLDSILFSDEKSSLLNWQTRFNIILQIGRGLVYLHHRLQFKIIHRDIKASNILLDREMEPKLSDFGMARSCGCDQTEVQTDKVVGTRGYMSPEYMAGGLFSIKSDVFSFGVLLLEIISGQKNKWGRKTNSRLTLLEHAWMQSRKRGGLGLLDPKAGDTFSALQVKRCIRVGLLCVQEEPEDRPTMSEAVLMLSGEHTSVPKLPKCPSYLVDDKAGSIKWRKLVKCCLVNPISKLKNVTHKAYKKTSTPPPPSHTSPPPAPTATFIKKSKRRRCFPTRVEGGGRNRGSCLPIGCGELFRSRGRGEGVGRRKGSGLGGIKDCSLRNLADGKLLFRLYK